MCVKVSDGNQYLPWDRETVPGPSDSPDAASEGLTTKERKRQQNPQFYSRYTCVISENV